MSNESDPDVGRLAAAADGASVTREALASTPAVVDALEADEQPHYLLRGMQMDVEQRLADDTEREDSRRRIVATGALRTVVTDRRLLLLVDRPERVEARSLPYADLESVECESAVSGNHRLVATGLDEYRYIDTGRSDADECDEAAAYADDRARAATPSAESAGAEAADPLTKLERLAALHERGALTDAEFDAKKRELLERL